MATSCGFESHRPHQVKQASLCNQDCNSLLSATCDALDENRDGCGAINHS
jgi:hypothetical protein